MRESRPARRSIRLPHYDYGSAGAYFVTIVCHRRMSLFGQIDGDALTLDALGKIAVEKWQSIPTHFPQASLDAFIVMPNHVHGILFLDSNPMAVGAQHAAPLRGKRPVVQSGSLGAIVRAYKAAVTREINLQRRSPGAKVWQRNYYERVIRDDPDLDEIRYYIVNNVHTWISDQSVINLPYW